MTQTQQHIIQSTSIISSPKIKEETFVSNEMLTITLKLLQEVFGATHCLMLRSNVESKKLIYAASQEDPKISSGLVKLSWLLSKQYRARFTQGQFIIFSQNKPFLPVSLKKIVKEQQINSILAIPLQTHSSSLEIIYLYHCYDDYSWTEKDLILIQHLVAQYNFNLIQAQQITQIEQKYQKQTLLKQIIQQLNSPQPPEDILTNILKSIGESFQVEQVLLLQIEKTQIQIYQHWQIYPNGSYHLVQDNLNPKWLKELADWEHTRQWCYFPDVTSSSEKPLLLSLVSIPIQVQGDFWGNLTLQTKNSQRRFTSEEINLLENITASIAIALYHLSIEKKQQKINEFLSHMTHELRAPLTGVLGFARMLQDQIYGFLNPKQNQYINAIVTSGEHLLAIINDFLDLSKIEADREDLEVEKLAVEDICLASLSIIQAKAEEQKLELILEIAPNVDFCWGDQQRLKQILVNLLSNAIKFTEVGSVKLKVELHNTHLAFCVIDTGIGIAPEEQEKLFQPFQQLHNHPLCRKHKGTGLGLALSRRLARLHGGDITLVSEQGQGSCFILEIPVNRG